MRLSKTSWICIGLIVLITAMLFQLNHDVLIMTHGCYNIFDILFM